MAAGLIIIYESNNLKNNVDTPTKDIAIDIKGEEMSPVDLLSLFVKHENPVLIGNTKYIYFSHEKNDCEFLLPTEEKIDFNKVIPLNVDACLNYFDEIQNVE